MLSQSKQFKMIDVQSERTISYNSLTSWRNLFTLALQSAENVMSELQHRNYILNPIFCMLYAAILDISAHGDLQMFNGEH